MSEYEKEVRAASDQFYVALNAMFTGDTALMNAVWSHQDDVTQMGPFGGRLSGWKAVSSEFDKAAALNLGGRVDCEELVVHATKDMGYSICVETGFNQDPQGKRVAVSHRATNIFRRESGGWKLVHHHTDISLQLQQGMGMRNK